MVQQVSLNLCTVPLIIGRSLFSDFSYFSISQGAGNDGKEGGYQGDYDNGHRRANVVLPPGWGKTQLSLQVLAKLFLDNSPSATNVQEKFCQYLKG